MKVTVSTRKGEIALTLPDNATFGQLKAAYIAERKLKLSPHRVSFKSVATNKTISVEDSKPLSAIGVTNDAKLLFKDLGPQIGYRTVFIWEYLGPLLIMLFYYARPAFVYGGLDLSQPHSQVATLGCITWVLHFVKREFETLFVHKFSHPTMPLFNLFKNCAYYWSFGALCGYFLCHPKYTPTASPALVYAGLAIFTVSEIGNFICHIMLSRLRKAEGSAERPIPRGFLFELVSCPNYTFEVLGWVGWSLMTSMAFGAAFTIVGFLQMLAWALKKHVNYRKSYKDYPRRRKAMVPFVI